MLSLRFRAPLSDMITGYGVAEAVRHYSIYGGDVKGKKEKQLFKRIW
jgi:hypothetical protein